MTLIVGIKWKGVAYLFADSAITSSVRSTGEGSFTSFGELEIDDGNSSVTESALKIVNAGDCAITFTGDVGTMNSIIDSMLVLTKMGVAGSLAFERAWLSNQPINRSRTVEILVAVSDLGRGASLWHFADGARNELADGTITVLGSARPATEAFIVEAFNRIAYHERDPQKILSVTLAVLQHFGLHDQTLRDGHGGAFAGIRVDKAGCQEQPDTLYVLYRGMKLPSDESFVTDMLLVRHQQNGLYLGRMNCNGSAGPNKVLHNPLWVQSDRLAKAQHALDELFGLETVRIYAFLCFGFRTVLLTDKQTIEQKQVIEVEPISTTAKGVRITVPGKTAKFLAIPPEKGRFSAAPIAIHALWIPDGEVK
ncbi:MAG: hypothetical protein WD768_04830 [Phycisphaeraceae bacterium]